MLNGKKIIVVMPAYNAEKTLEKTYSEIYNDIVDDIILTDDCSSDKTKEIAKNLNITTIIHDKNEGYGANQKSCYAAALNADADVIIMLHPDYQYTPKLVPAVASMLAFGEYDAVLASRILNNGALKGGMPLYKYIANRFLTLFQNIITGSSLSEYHTGFRGFTKEVLLNLPLDSCSDDFIFDDEIITLIMYYNYKIGEISCPTKYFHEASSINFIRSCHYGFGVIVTSILYLLAKLNIYKSKIFDKNAKKLNLSKNLKYFYKKNI
ncbi:glycosyltransferase family 2 protein [bacterium]|nr:glycosyltransferase family 2 protein [bacterium]